jgi:OFA family oxalate/formate antiporter-like MFS transporter
LFPATSGDYFGSRHATSNYGVLYTAKGVAAVIGPWMGALLAERSGSWALGFYGSAIMALIAAVMAVRLRAVAATLKAAKLQTAVSPG